MGELRVGNVGVLVGFVHQAPLLLRGMEMHVRSRITLQWLHACESSSWHSSFSSQYARLFPSFVSHKGIEWAQTKLLTY